MDVLELDSYLPYRLHRLANLVSARFATVYGREYGLKVPEWRILAALGELGVSTARDIGVQSSMHKTKVSRAVFALEQRRWVTREKNLSDRREENLRLTVQGQAAYRQLIPKLKALEEALLGNLSPSERTALNEALDAMEREHGIRSEPSQSSPVAAQ